MHSGTDHRVALANRRLGAVLGRLGATLALLLGCVWIACADADPLVELRAQQARGDFSGSVEPLRELLGADVVRVEAYYLYGRALAVTGQTNLAHWSLRKAMTSPDWLLPAGLQLAYGSLSTGNAREAIEVLDRVLEAHPDSSEALLLRANAYAETRVNYSEALVDVERLEELDPDSPEVLKPKIRALLGLERAEEAGAAIDELGKRISEVETDSHLSGWHCATAAIFAEESDEPELAAERWADCSERFPTNASVLSNALTYYDSVGAYDRALEILRAALEEEPSSRDFRGMLAERLRAVGRLAEGESVLLEGTKSEVPRAAAAAWIDLAKYYQGNENFAAAADAADKAVEFATQVGEVHLELRFQHADALLLAGRLDEALAVADALSLPAYREMIRARVAQQRGQPRRALEHYDEAFRLWPDNAWARYHAALAAEAIGDFERAIEEYRYSVRLSADATDAKLRLARLLLAEGRAVQASAILQRHTDAESPAHFEETLLALQVWASIGREESVRKVLASMRGGPVKALARAAAETAKGLVSRGGPQAAVRMLRSLEAQGLDFSDPRNADALRALVRYGHHPEQRRETEKTLGSAMSSSPEAAEFHDIQGLWLELNSAPSGDVRQAYEKALALDPANPQALLFLARVHLASDPERARNLFGVALKADANDAEALRGLGAALIQMGLPLEAEQRLRDLLTKYPYDARAAAQLAELQLERDEATPQTVELARRAVRFGGGAEADALLERALRQSEAE
jgi:tetratricopeptide (TPR) repeat protein